jgi:uncharacterized repeat protein (TIGR03803 family)
MKAAFVAFLISIFLLSVSDHPARAATFKIIHDFSGGSDGKLPSWAPTLGPGGKLFGSTLGGGNSQGGVVYQLSPNNDGTWDETILHSFDFATEGDGLARGVVLDAQANLYGTTADGGPGGSGTVFELSSSDSSLSLLYALGGDVRLVLSETGDIYAPLGPGDYKAGAVGELSPDAGSWTYTALYSFCAHPPQCPDGDLPSAPLIWDTSGNLYGTTLDGGVQPPTCGQPLGCGVVFQLSPTRNNTWAYHLIHSFGTIAGDGQAPAGGLVRDRFGGLYGATSYGGPNFLNGTIYKLMPSTTGRGWKESVIYTFPDCSQGCSPYDELAVDKAGNLYGVANGGNTSCFGASCGVVYRLSLQRNGSWKYSVLHKFSGSDGAAPNGVIVGTDGNLYGTAEFGGDNNLGVAFEITP